MDKEESLLTCTTMHSMTRLCRYLGLQSIPVVKEHIKAAQEKEKEDMIEEYKRGI